MQGNIVARGHYMCASVQGRARCAPQGTSETMEHTWENATTCDTVYRHTLQTLAKCMQYNFHTSRGHVHTLQHINIGVRCAPDEDKAPQQRRGNVVRMVPTDRSLSLQAGRHQLLLGQRLTKERVDCHGCCCSTGGAAPQATAERQALVCVERAVVHCQRVLCAVEMP